MTIPGNYNRGSVNDKHPKKKTESYKQFAENQAVAPWKMFVWKGKSTEYKEQISSSHQ